MEKIVFTCSCFDLLHPGHLLMLKDARAQGTRLIVGLQTDPTLDREDKNKPIQTLEERRIMLEGCRYIDEIIEYSTENDLLILLKKINPDVRVLGTDWQGKPFTGHELNIPIYWHSRTHDYSTSNLRQRIFKAESEKIGVNHHSYM